MRTRYRSLVFGLITLTVSTVLGLALLLAVDIYFHHRFAKAAGLNIWGYRGPTAPKKNVDSWRIAVVGGSTAFGYGVEWRKSFPSLLEAQLRQARPDDDISVVNLAYNNEGAYSFSFTLSDYAYLDYDVVLLYTGYNDIDPNNRQVYRQRSPIFRLVGYSPILPLVLREKSYLLLHGGNLNDTYEAYAEGGKPVFTENLVNRTAGAALAAVVNMGDSLGDQLNKVIPQKTSPLQAVGLCARPWDFYCKSVHKAVSQILHEGKTALVVTQPYMNNLHREQQKELADMLRKKFAGESNVYYTNLGNAIELEDTDLAFDGMHLVAEGNKRIAEHLVQPILEIKNR